jgi:hypothetical protein
MLVLLFTLLGTSLPYPSFASNYLSLGPQQSEESRSGLDPDQARRILNATVQIFMISLVQGQGPEEDGVKLSNGLGTLVNHGDDMLLITHDHWPYFDQVEIVQLYDAEGKLILKISGEEFLLSILYRDTGTLALKIPGRPEICESISAQKPDREEEMVRLAGAELADAEAVPKGAVVYVARHEPDDPLRVNLMAAKVVAHKTQNGVRVFKLISLDGAVVLHGDSGGGLWYKGKLVGNTWMTFIDLRRSTETKEIYLDRSTAAQLPESIVNNCARPTQ